MGRLITVKTDRKKLYKRDYEIEVEKIEKAPDISADPLCEYMLKLVFDYRRRKADEKHS